MPYYPTTRLVCIFVLIFTINCASAQNIETFISNFEEKFLQEKIYVPVWGGLTTQEIAGFSKPREFYSPDYSVSGDMDETKDVRSTLYWNPYVLTDKDNRKVRIVFYNNDISNKLQLTLEGMNANGKLTRVTKLLELMKVEV